MTIMKRTLVPLASLCLAACSLSAAANLPLADGFAYSVGNLGAVGSSGGWDANSFSTVAITSGNLTGPTGFPASTGDMIVLSKGTGSNYFTFASNGQFTSGQIYFSFLFKPGSSSGASSSGLDIAALTAQNATTPAINLQLRNNSGFKLGMKKAGGTATFPATALTSGTTYLVIGKYDFATAPNTASLWILTSYPSNEVAAGAAAVSINSGTDFTAAAGLGRFYLDGAGVPTASVNVDELRIGTNWASVVSTVTSAPPPVVVSVPVITQAQHNGAQFILHGNNGTAGSAYEVLCTSNLALPTAQWPVVGSNVFTGAGLFDATNPVNAASPQWFYCLRVGGGSGATNPPPGTPPSIVTQPQSNSVSVGGTAMFSVAATGSAPLRYQWFFNNAVSSGATNSSLTLFSVATNQAGNYFVRVTNDFGAVTSSIVALTVNPAPTGAVFYVSTTGSDANPGTLAAPFATVSKAQSVMGVGDTIYLRGGTYNLSAQVKLTIDGTAASYCKLWAYPGERPVFDFA
ncbi:MAG: hypothetical protein RLY20_1339, partial [Verrucomicrobiota bacterium]